MNYSEVLSKSWKIIWKYKILWVFGILAGCAESSGGGSGGGGSSSGYTSGGYNNGNFNGNEFLSTLESYVYKVTDFIQNIPWWVWVLAAILLMALIVVSIFLGIVGRSGVIAALVIFALYMPVGILLSGVLRSYIYTAWTLTYRRLSAAPAEAQVYGIEPLPIVVPPAVEPPLS